MSEKIQLFVAKLAIGTTDADIRKHFRKYGDISDVTIKKTYAFIDLITDISLKEVVDNMDNTKLNGRRIVVEKAGSSNNKSSRGPNENDDCFNCGRFGHWANEC